MAEQVPRRYSEIRAAEDFGGQQLQQSEEVWRAVREPCAIANLQNAAFREPTDEAIKVQESKRLS